MQAVRYLIRGILFLFLVLTISDCSNEKTSLTDIDGNTYEVKDFQGVLWMTENLRTTKDNSGNTVTYFLPNNDQQSVSEYGLLYDFATACKV